MGMETKHIFVAAVDVGEILPFVIRTKKNVKESLVEQERARLELERFIDVLESKYKEKIWYMGMDVIAGKNYERFIFDKGGFFEIMVEAPLALNAHFVNEKKAEKFRDALKECLTVIIPKGPISDMFINAIEVQKEESESLTYKEWNNLKKIRNT